MSDHTDERANLIDALLAELDALHFKEHAAAVREEAMKRRIVELEAALTPLRERLHSLAHGVIRQCGHGAEGRPRKVIECSSVALFSWADEIEAVCDALAARLFPPQQETTNEQE